MDKENKKLSNHGLSMQDDRLLQEILDHKHLLGEKDKLIDDLWLMKYRYDAL